MRKIFRYKISKYFLPIIFCIKNQMNFMQKKKSKKNMHEFLAKLFL